MLRLSRYSVLLSLSIVVLCACKASTQAPAPTPLTTITAPQGGRIVYGAVSGATTQSAVLTSLLARVHNLCGEKPQIGRVFQFTGTNSVGVFFTVTDHPEGNIPLAGMVIARSTGPNQVDGAMLYDVASRFGTTVNPMLQQLSGVWQQGGQAASGSPSGATAASASGSATGGQAASPAGLHQVMLPDSTASVSIPAGWTVDPQSGGGGMRVYGTHGEVVTLDNTFLAQDPNAPVYRSMMQKGMKPLKGQVVYSPNVDLVKALPDIIQLFRKSQGMAATDLKIDHAEQVSPPQGATSEGERCVQATGQINPDGKGMKAMFRVVCASAPNQYGDYSFFDYNALFPTAEASQVSSLGSAIVSSFQVNIALVTQRATAQAAPEIAHLKQVDAQQRQATQAFTANAVNNIHAIGANATARMNATEAANSAEQASWNAGQNANAQNAQGFSNYLLDQSVVQNNSTGAHATLWNNAADGLVQSNPNKYSYVSNPNLVPGTDF